METECLPAPDRIDPPFSREGTWIVTDDAGGVSEALVSRLVKFKEQIVLLAFPGQRPIETVQERQAVHREYLTDFSGQTLETALNRIIESRGPVCGFIHVHPKQDRPISIQSAFQERDYAIVKSVFLAAKYLGKSFNGLTGLTKNRPCFATVTQMDGSLGVGDGDPYAFIQGGLSGLTKSLHREWPAVFCRHIDIAPQTVSESAAKMILEELSDPAVHILETGRTEAGDRYTLKAKEHPRASAGMKKPNKDTLFLVTGGGRGITAHCVCEMAKAFQCKFILLGRTKRASGEPEWSRHLSDEVDLKSGAIAYLKQQEHQPTPADVRKTVKSILSNREINQTLSKIEEYGGQGLYVSADITDSATLVARLNEAQVKLGKIDGIIHGAGNLADKKISNKTEYDFSLVFDTKIKGLETILKAIPPEQLRFFILFSSVSGFFGNAGQTDYAMANEVLNKFAYCFKQFFPDCFSTAINWGPWESGMVTDTLKGFYEQYNIRLIPVNVGADFCEKELHHAKEGDAQILICGDLAAPGETKAHQPEAAGITRTIDPQANAFLSDHVIGGHRVLPATCAIQWMIQSCATILAPLYKFSAVKHFKVLNGVRFLTPDPLTYRVDIDPMEISERYTDLKVKITSKSHGKLPGFHYSAVLRFIKTLDPASVYGQADIKQDGIISQTREELYGPDGFLFHGNVFRGVQKVININDSRITTLCQLPEIPITKQGQFPVTLFNPYVVDIQLHCSLIWTKHQLSRQCLPLEFEEVLQYKPIDFNTEFYVSGMIKSYTQSRLIIDITAHDITGSIYHAFKNAQFILKAY